MSLRFREYADESGDHTYHNIESPDRRYLGLTGIVVESETYRTQFHSGLIKLKQDHFPHNPDDPVILHRNDLINKRGSFRVLLDETKDKAFCTDLLQFLKTQDYKVFTVVIDKKSHIERYKGAALHPYHYCLTVLMERYRGFLGSQKAVGDILAESRGGEEDRELKRVYTEVYERGTYYISAALFQQTLTTREIKLKKKSENISGLQIGDIIAYPHKQQILIENGIPGITQGRFGKEIMEAIRLKQNSYSKTFIK